MLYDELPIAQKAAMMRVCIKNGITNPDDIRTAYNNYVEGRNIFDGLSESYHRASAFGQFLANGGHLYGGKTEKTQKMQVGRKFWERLAQAPTILEQKEAYLRQKEAEDKRRIAELRQALATRGAEIARQRQSDYLTASNDNTWVENRDPRVAAARPKNPHLAERALQGKLQGKNCLTVCESPPRRIRSEKDCGPPRL